MYVNRSSQHDQFMHALAAESPIELTNKLLSHAVSISAILLPVVYIYTYYIVFGAILWNYTPLCVVDVHVYVIMCVQ